MFTMIVRDYMSTPAITAWIDSDVGEAVRTMYARNIHHLPAVDAQYKLVGIVTRRGLEGAPDADPVTVHMTRSPHLTHPDTTLVKAATKMRDLHVGALPVVNRSELVASSQPATSSTGSSNCWEDGVPAHV